MKKRIVLLLVLIMTLSLCACGKDAGKKNDDAPKEVELTTDNIEDYLAFTFDYAEVTKKNNVLGIPHGYTEITLSTYAVRGGTFNNVEITVEVPLSVGWEVSSSDKAYVEGDADTLTCSFRLPANGDYSETHDLSSITAIDPKTNVKYQITNVSGSYSE